MKSGFTCRQAGLGLVVVLIAFCCLSPGPLAQTTPLLDVDVAALDFGETETTKTFTIANAGSGTLTWSLVEDESWLSAVPTSGSLDAGISETVTVEVDRTQVPIPGEITGTIGVISNDLDLEIAVSMIIATPILDVDPTQLDFGETQSSMVFTIANAGGGTLDWSLSQDGDWFSAEPTSGTLEAAFSETVTVAVDRSGLFPVGTVNGLLTVTASEVSAPIGITMMPLRTVGPASLEFGSEAVVKELFINNRGSGSLEWSITTQDVWAGVDRASGSTDEGMLDVVLVMVDRAAVTSLGSYSDVLEIDSDAGNVAVPLTMEKSNHPPQVPVSISPPDGATNQPRTTTLTCQGGDGDGGDGDVVSYTLYLSTDHLRVAAEDSTVIICSDMSTCYCDPGSMMLEHATTYYWKAVAEDSYGVTTSSPVWSFSTEASANGFCPALALELEEEDFSRLRRLRDETLFPDEEGRSYIATYYRHGWELFLILLTFHELRIEAREILEAVLPLSAAVLKNREAVVPGELVGRVTAFLGRVSRYAHPQLKSALRGLQSRFQKEASWARFGITITGDDDLASFPDQE